AATGLAIAVFPRLTFMAIFAVAAAAAVTRPRLGILPALFVPITGFQLGLFGDPRFGAAVVACVFALGYWAFGAGRPRLPLYGLLAVGTLGLSAIALGIANGIELGAAAAWPVLWLGGIVLGACLAAVPSRITILGFGLLPPALLIFWELTGRGNFWAQRLGTTEFADLGQLENATRAFSTFGHPLIAGAVFAVVGALLLAEGSRRSLPLAVVMFGASMGTVSRSALLAVAIVVFVVAIQSAKNPLRAGTRLILPLVGALVLISVIPGLKDSVTTRVSGGVGPQVVRGYALDSIRSDAEVRPGQLLVGGGLGAARDKISAVGGRVGSLETFDNQYVTSVYDYGVLPLLIASGLVVVGLRKSRSLMLGLPAVLATLIAVFFFDGFYTLPVGFFGALAFGVALAPRAGPAATKPDRPDRTSRDRRHPTEPLPSPTA
ncbi:MAG: hypothetical protein Q7T55_17340, partial [Solirubrobacteraceae bacterium]|nr:hypothetical protein [Solirubrobacteraceae bacterium]